MGFELIFEKVNLKACQESDRRCTIDKQLIPIMIRGLLACCTDDFLVDWRAYTETPNECQVQACIKYDFLSVEL